MNEELIRINKYLSEAGVCSRREADKLIEAGRVIINGIPALPGSKVSNSDIVVVDGRIIDAAQDRIVYAFNKPRGYISSLSDEQGEGISQFVPAELRLYPVGRLDKESNGLMLLTNDGELMNKILSAAGGHEKEYEVTVNHNITSDFLKSMESGVEITNGSTGERVRTAPAKVRKINNRTFRIILIQGLNRQIRRMCGELGYSVIELKRIRIMNIELDQLEPGQLRIIDNEDREKLYLQLQ